MFQLGLTHAPIKIKIFLAQGIVTLSAIFVLLLITLLYQYSSYKGELQGDIEVQSTVIERSSTAAILFKDNKTANEMLSTLQLVPSINRAYIFFEEGTLFASYVKEGDKLPAKVSLPALRQLKSTDKKLVSIKDIVLDGRIIGTLFIEANLDKLNERFLLFILAAVFASLLGLLISSFLSMRINRFLIQPIFSLTKLVDDISVTHDYQVRSAINTGDELGKLSSGINQMLHSIELRDKRLEEELIQRKQDELELDRLAYYDNVTELHNRHYFNEQLQVSVANTVYSNKVICLMFVDLDDFKVVNDTYGHRDGDALLKEVGKRISSLLNAGDEVYRIGGDEFAIIVADNSQYTHAREIAEAVILKCSEKFLINNTDIYIGASIGISSCPEHGVDIPDLLRSADSAMYRAKREGKNNYKFFSKNIDDETHFRHYLETALRNALNRNELEVYYQPIINIKSQLIVGFEALLRWHEPVYGDINPVEFIPCAERIGMILPIGQWVLRQACMQLKHWQQMFGYDFTMNVNLSGIQLREADIVHKIIDVVSETGIQPTSLNIELTESVLMDNSPSTINKFHALRAAGVSISIDDFGTGFSSLSYLKRFPITTIKIDRSFIMDIASDTEDQAITLAIIALANSLKLTVVAEGVETTEQLDILHANNCEKAQGYLFSKPLPAQDIENLMHTHANVRIGAGVR